MLNTGLIVGALCITVTLPNFNYEKNETFLNQNFYPARNLAVKIAALKQNSYFLSNLKKDHQLSPEDMYMKLCGL